MAQPESWKPFTKKKYVISRDEYFGVKGGMDDFEGTWRELLLHVLGIDDEAVWDEDGWAVSGRHVHSVKEMTDDELIKWFDDANGDGQQYIMVWDVEGRKQVLG